jgi:sugar-specific transcriptional regulator TrmB
MGQTKVGYNLMIRGTREIAQTRLNNTWQRLCEYLGLSEYEAKVYVALIETGHANARTLSVMSGVPRTKVYSVLRKLIEINLVVEIPEEPRKFAPTPPETALKSYLKSYQNMVENLVSVVSSLEETFKKAKNEEKLQRGELWLIIGRQQILKKIREMLSRAKHSVGLVTNGNGMVLLYKEFNRLFDELGERSVKVWITTPNGSNSQHMLSELKYTCKIKQANFELPMIFLCVDE